MHVSVYHCNLVAFVCAGNPDVLILRSIEENISKTHPNYKRMDSLDQTTLFFMCFLCGAKASHFLVFPSPTQNLAKRLEYNVT